MVLSQFYPDYLLGFVFLNALDLVSHFARLTRYVQRRNSHNEKGETHLLHSQYVTAKKSHKDGSANHPWILNIYYNSRAVLCILCAGNELFYCLLYLFYFTPGQCYFCLCFFFFLGSHLPQAQNSVVLKSQSMPSMFPFPSGRSNKSLMGFR